MRNVDVILILQEIIETKNNTRERMIYLQELRSLGHVPSIDDFYDYIPLMPLEKEWNHFQKSSLAHKLRSVGVPEKELQEILFDTFFDEYLNKTTISFSRTINF